MAETKENIPEIKQREAGMTLCVGAQGVGKTYLHMYVIRDYVRDKIESKVRGRKCLIFDTNGEFTQKQFEENGIPNFPIQTIKMRDIEEWGLSNRVECRRVDAKALSIDEKIKCVSYIINKYRDGMLVLEDINTYILSVTHMGDIISGLVNLRHRGVDILISYQDFRAVEPRIFSNSRWFRFHYQSVDVMEVKSKIPNVELCSIAQIIVNNKYFNDDIRFYLYVYKNINKIRGKFSKDEFYVACREYLNGSRSMIKTLMNRKKISEDEAIKFQSDLYYKMYYGNDNK